MKNKNKKILIFGDNHGLINNIEKIKSLEKPDITIHTGDFNNWNGEPNNYDINYLENNFDYYVFGNHNIEGKTVKNFENVDKYREYMVNINHIEYFLKKDIKLFKINNFNFLLMHSFNFDENLITHYGRIKYSFEFDKEKWYKEISNIVKEHNIDYIISGHTHVPEIIKFETCQVLNPGSIEFPFQENKKPSYIIMEINDKEVKINKKFI